MDHRRKYGPLSPNNNRYTIKKNRLPCIYAKLAEIEALFKTGEQAVFGEIPERAE